MHLAASVADATSAATSKPSWSFRRGVTVIVGANAQGKTSLLEAVGLGGDRRVVPRGARRRARPRGLRGGHRAGRGGRRGADAAARGRDPRRRAATGCGSTVTRSRVPSDRRELVRVTVFAPDDLQLVKGGPAERRDVPRRPAGRRSRPATRRCVGDYERVLRQRNALLKQRLGSDPDDETTLEVFDTQLARAGAELARGRLRMLERLVPLVEAAYGELAGRPGTVDATYPRSGQADRRRRAGPKAPRSASIPTAGRHARGRAPGGTREPAPGRARAQGDAGRPAPRRVAAAGRRARRPHARLAGRAAHARARPAPRRPPPRAPTSSGPRRCCSSTTCSASSTTSARAALVAQPRRRADAGHHGGRAAGRRARRARVAGRRRRRARRGMNGATRHAFRGARGAGVPFRSGAR